VFNEPHFIDEFLSIVKPLNIKTALEVGRLSGELKDALTGIGIDCQGIELNPTRSDVIKGDFMKHPFTNHYDLVFSSGVLEHYDRLDAQNMILRMAEIGTYVLNFVPNRDCTAYMKAKHKTKEPWGSEEPYTVAEIIAPHDFLEPVQPKPWGYAGYEWSKRFGGDGSQPYLVWCLRRKPCAT
jgi:hypothetical protein